MTVEKTEKSMLYKAVRTACVAADKSVAQLAREYGTTTQNFYKRLENEKLNSKELSKIADLLGCEFSYSFTPKK